VILERIPSPCRMTESLLDHTAFQIQIVGRTSSDPHPTSGQIITLVYNMVNSHCIHSDACWDWIGFLEASSGMDGLREPSAANFLSRAPKTASLCRRQKKYQCMSSKYALTFKDASYRRS
jgi:hypothetical protein